MANVESEIFELGIKVTRAKCSALEAEVKLRRWGSWIFNYNLTMHKATINAFKIKIQTCNSKHHSKNAPLDIRKDIATGVDGNADDKSLIVKYVSHLKRSKYAS